MRCIQKQVSHSYADNIVMEEFNPNTRRVLEYIQKNPGSHMRQIKTDLGLSMGTTIYHLNLLEKMSRIVSERSVLHRTYYPAGIFDKNEKLILKILNQGTVRDILLYVIEAKNPTQTEIVEKIKISAPAVNWHIQQLIKLEIISESRDGKYKRYSLIGKTDQITTLLKNYHPKAWQKLNDRIVELFLSVEINKKNESN